MYEDPLGFFTGLIVWILAIALIVVLFSPLGDSVIETLKDMKEESSDAGEAMETEPQTIEDPNRIVGTMASTHTITLNTDLPAGSYTLRYEAAGSVITRYADICSLRPGASYEGFILQNVAPEEAAYIGVYNANEQRVGRIEFTESFRCPADSPLYRFAALSDPHVGYGDENYAFALNFLTRTEEVSFVVVSGDLTDSCTEWETYSNIVGRNAGGVPVYEIPGNHDSAFWLGYTTGENYNNEDIVEYTPFIREQIETHTENSLYYSFEMGQDLYLMMGTQSNYGGRMFSQESLQWLYETLEANRDRRCFVIAHVPPDGASGNANGWAEKEDMDGTEQTVFTSLLEHYPNVVLFHGHTHQAFRLQEEARDATYDNYLGCHSVHVPSVGGTRGPLPEDNGGSQGYTVEVYEDAILLQGIDFLTGKYVPLARYWLDTPLQSVAANTYTDSTYTIGWEKPALEWIPETGINRKTGEPVENAEYASTALLTLDPGKNYYFHTSYESPYKVEIYCYDASGELCGAIEGPWSGEKYREPVALDPLLPKETASIRITMWTSIWVARKTMPIFITAVP